MRRKIISAALIGTLFIKSASIGQYSNPSLEPHNPLINETPVVITSSTPYSSTDIQIFPSPDPYYTQSEMTIASNPANPQS